MVVIALSYVSLYICMYDKVRRSLDKGQKMGILTVPAYTLP